MVTNFVRDLHDYPKVWSCFKRILKNGNEVEFQIKDLTADMFDEAKQMMKDCYMKDEIWSVTAGVPKDPEAMEEFAQVFAKIMVEKLSLGLFKNEDNQLTLVGLTLCIYQDANAVADSLSSQPKTEAAKLVSHIIHEAMKLNNIPEKLNVSKVLFGTGLTISKEYRGLGLAVELLKAREKLAKSLGIEAVGSIFTGRQSQRTAEIAGLVVTNEISYEEFGLICNVKFETNTEKMVCAAIRI